MWRELKKESGIQNLEPNLQVVNKVVSQIQQLNVKEEKIELPLKKQ